MPEMRNSGSQRIRVLFIAGMVRSGSTVLARLFGQIDGFFNSGEGSRYLFSDAMQARASICGCGKNVGDCPFWGDLPGLPSAAVRLLASDLLRMRRLPSQVLSLSTPKATQLVLDAQRDVLAEMQRRSGCRVIVDSSKNPSNAFLMARIPEVELHVLHLVRDSRAVVASSSRAKGYLRRHGELETAVFWLAQNLSAELLRTRACSYRRVLWEDAVTDVRALIERTVGVLGEADASLSFIRGDQAVLSPQHCLAGNPDKLVSGRLTLRATTPSLSRRIRWMVTLLTAPLLCRYGYRFQQAGPST